MGGDNSGANPSNPHGRLASFARLENGAGTPGRAEGALKQGCGGSPSLYPSILLSTALHGRTSISAIYHLSPPSLHLAVQPVVEIPSPRSLHPPLQPIVSHPFPKDRSRQHEPVVASSDSCTAESRCLFRFREVPRGNLANNQGERHEHIQRQDQQSA